MYIGSTSLDGLHQLVFEIVDNSIDEALVGACSSISVLLGKGNVVIVEDDGRGIPVDIHPTEKISALEVVMTKLNAGGKFDKNTYKVSGGLHGVGASVVNALSEWCEVEVHRDGKIYYQKYVRGAPEKPVAVIGDTTKHGTVTRFKPDKQIFEDIEFSFDVLSNRLRELAFLTKGIRISVGDERALPKKSHIFHFDGGVKSFIEYLNKNKELIHQEPVYFDSERDYTRVEIGLQYNDGYTETIFTFANNINTREGGTHLVGFKSALTRCLNDYLKKLNLSKKLEENLSGEDVREGMTAVISVKVPEPQFEGQTKAKPGQLRGEGHRGKPHLRPADPVLRREPRCRQEDPRQVDHGRKGPGSGAQGAGADAQEGPAGELGPPRASSPTAPRMTLRSASCTSSKVTPRAAAPSRDGTGCSRQSSPCGARC